MHYDISTIFQRMDLNPNQQNPDQRCQMATKLGRSARNWPNGRPPTLFKALF
nr:unnamed protein product [Digitaria exilis]